MLRDESPILIEREPEEGSFNLVREPLKYCSILFDEILISIESQPEGLILFKR